MSRDDPDKREHPGESRTAWYRRLRGTFIVENLQFSPDLSVGQYEVRDAYRKWIGEPGKDFYAPAIGNLYKSITRMGATLDDKKKTFYGVGMRT